MSLPAACRLSLALLLALGLPAQAQSPFAGLLARIEGAGDQTGVTASNGRLEAQSVDVAGKYAGRLTEVTAAEGQMVEAGGGAGAA
ncbi:hypothetical protein ACTTAL_03200 [Rhodobacter capsulatus]